MLILYTTVHLLKNLARQEAIGLGMAIYWDGTCRTVATGQPCFFLGTNDVDQHFHLAAGGIIDSENTSQCETVLDTVLFYLNRIRNREDENAGKPARVDIKPHWVVADNSDALQAAAESKGAVPVSCKAHVIRNAKGAAGIIATSTMTRNEAVKVVQADISRISRNTLYSGVSVDYDAGKIADVLPVLFTKKHAIEQGAYVQKFEDEYMGPRKGAWQAAHTNPSVPVHNNGIEKFNDSFKVDGKRPFISLPLSMFELLCFKLHWLLRLEHATRAQCTLILTPNSHFVIGTGRLLHSINGGNAGIVHVLKEFMETKSRMDCEFSVTPTLVLNDWQQAQLAQSRDNIGLHAVMQQVKFFQESGRVRDVYYLPSSKVVAEAEKHPDTKARINTVLRKFNSVFKKGLTALGDDDLVYSLGFDHVVEILDSCVVLFELDEPEDEIKYQCSCYEFWHYYKCHHSLAMSIRKKGVRVPEIYNLKNIGSTKRRGRPCVARGGEALSGKGKKAKK